MPDEYFFTKVPHGVPSHLAWCWHFKTKFTAFDSHNGYLIQITFISQARKVKVQRNTVSCSKKAIRPSNLKLRVHFIQLFCFVLFPYLGLCSKTRVSLYSPDWPPACNPTYFSLLSAWLKALQKRALNSLQYKSFLHQTVPGLVFREPSRPC